MKANEFIKKYGLDEAKKSNALSINLGHEDLELKRLIESYELVEKCGSLISCKKILFARINHKPKAQYFAIHPEKPNLIQLYMRNEAKLIPNYRFRDLEKAIADVESCQ